MSDPNLWHYLHLQSAIEKIVGTSVLIKDNEDAVIHKVLTEWQPPDNADIFSQQVSELVDDVNISASRRGPLRQKLERVLSLMHDLHGKLSDWIERQTIDQNFAQLLDNFTRDDWNVPSQWSSFQVRCARRSSDKVLESKRMATKAFDPADLKLRSTVHSWSRKFIAACPDGEIRILDLSEAPQSTHNLPDSAYRDRYVGMNLIVKYWMDQSCLDAFWRWVDNEKPLSPKWEDMRPIALDPHEEIIEFENDEACVQWINERFRYALEQINERFKYAPNPGSEDNKMCGVMKGPCKFIETRFDTADSTGEVYFESERQYDAHNYQDIISLEYEWLPHDLSPDYVKADPITFREVLSNAFDLKFCSGDQDYFTIIGMFKEEGKEPCIFHFESHCSSKHYRRPFYRYDVYASPVCRLENLGNGLPRTYLDGEYYWKWYEKSGI
ncbi:hypothetical protein BDK51DRAFT_29625 [Blyttiomyces helicus]|uniref:Uncharacterized protein n=1 Tax=Blyttiomyces helicus TaxID=388810 RepID=A0A4P9WNE7_9FUNG|nr:hypothetical protein BDK51DRAFT_29625 [Blyttiomyces helicus]|eukprot:RKO94629.1 hypothetical protein BDK51DRAFT_29625 [Blyttiomyces helicus]